MKKLLCILMILMVVCCGCSNTAGKGDRVDAEGLAEKIETAIQEDGMYLPYRNCNFTIYNDFNATRFFTFPLISEGELVEQEISIDLGIETPYTYTVEKVENIEIPYYAYLCYKDLDWEKAIFLYNKDDKKDYLDYLGQYVEEFKSFETESMSNIFFYRVTIGLQLNPQMKENEEINEVKIVAKGKEYSFHIGQIIIDYETKENFGGDGLMCDTLAISEYYISPSKEGKIEVPEIEFKTLKDVVIKNVTLYQDEETKVAEANFEITSPGNTINRKLNKGETIQIESGAKVVMNLFLQTEALAGKLDYSTMKYILIEYETEGTTYYEKVELSGSVVRNYFEYICEETKTAEFEEYYFKYLCNIDENNQIIINMD